MKHRNLETALYCYNYKQGCWLTKLYSIGQWRKTIPARQLRAVSLNAMLWQGGVIHKLYGQTFIFVVYFQMVAGEICSTFPNVILIHCFAEKDSSNLHTCGVKMWNTSSKLWSLPVVLNSRFVDCLCKGDEITLISGVWLDKQICARLTLMSN